MPKMMARQWQQHQPRRADPRSTDTPLQAPPPGQRFTGHERSNTDGTGSVRRQKVRPLMDGMLTSYKRSDEPPHRLQSTLATVPPDVIAIITPDSGA